MSAPCAIILAVSLLSLAWPALLAILASGALAAGS